MHVWLYWIGTIVNERKVRENEEKNYRQRRSSESWLTTDRLYLCGPNHPTPPLSCSHHATRRLSQRALRPIDACVELVACMVEVSFVHVFQDTASFVVLLTVSTSYIRHPPGQTKIIYSFDREINNGKRSIQIPN